MTRMLLVDTLYASVSVAALVVLFFSPPPRRSLDEFSRKCLRDISQGHTGDVAYRDQFTVKHYSPDLWCNVSWLLVALLSNKWRMLGLANALVAMASLARKILVQFIFGRLTLSDAHHSYDRILNFVLFKVVSVRATLDADWEDLAIWTIAYCCFGALYLIGGLARDHLEHLRLSPAQPGIRWGFVGLMVMLMVLATVLAGLCWTMLRPLFGILLIEALTILFDVGQTLVKYLAYAWDSDSTESWEARSDAVLVCEFSTDICILLLTLLHYMHILVINGIALNIVSVLVFLNIRSIASKLFRKVRKLVAFWRAVESMRCRFPDATKEDIIRFNDRCSICREVLMAAKKLPCDHLFHRSCLRSWLVRHLSCPTCRVTLSGGDVGQWAAAAAAASSHASPDASAHGSDMIFAAATTSQ